MKTHLTVLALLLAGGCLTPPPLPEHDGLEVAIKQSHVHSKYCGHYRAGNRWYYIARHRHGVNCGHELIEATWILTR